MPRLALWFGLAALVVLLDRASKALVLLGLAHGESRALTDFFNLVLVFNRGAAFSFLAAAPGWQKPFFVAIGGVAAVVISYLLVKYSRKNFFCIGLALILGGALGNLWDRLIWGHVIDFLDFHAAGWHWPAFNVADSAITVGAAILIVESFLGRNQGSREKRA